MEIFDQYIGANFEVANVTIKNGENGRPVSRLSMLVIVTDESLEMFRFTGAWGNLGHIGRQHHGCIGEWKHESFALHEVEIAERYILGKMRRAEAGQDSAKLVFEAGEFHHSWSYSPPGFRSHDGNGWQHGCHRSGDMPQLQYFP